MYWKDIHNTTMNSGRYNHLQIQDKEHRHNHRNDRTAIYKNILARITSIVMILTISTNMDPY
jgi:pantothenate kinase-related protein Tda10